MKHFDLESKLKSLPVPDPGEEFWQTLSQRVLARAQAAPAPACPAAPLRRSLFTMQNSRIILAALVAAFCLWQSRIPQALARRVVQDGRQTRLALAQLPERLDTLMHDEHGLHDLVQDPP